MSWNVFACPTWADEILVEEERVLSMDTQCSDAFSGCLLIRPKDVLRMIQLSHLTHPIIASHPKLLCPDVNVGTLPIYRDLVTKLGHHPRLHHTLHLLSPTPPSWSNTHTHLHCLSTFGSFKTETLSPRRRPTHPPSCPLVAHRGAKPRLTPCFTMSGLVPGHTPSLDAQSAQLESPGRGPALPADARLLDKITSANTPFDVRLFARLSVI